MNCKHLLFASVLALGACASEPYIPTAKVVEAAKTPVICEGKEACDIMWSKAQIWVSENSGYKIQVATDSIIETYTAPDYSPEYSVKMTKMPLGNGKQELSLSIYCGYPAMCREKPVVFQARFRRAMLGIPLN
jgi:hypothetical protein